MDIAKIKEMMDNKLITEVVDIEELAKKSDDHIREYYITHVVDLPDFSNDDVVVDEPVVDEGENEPTDEPTDAPTDEPTDAPTDEPADEPVETPEDGGEPVVDEGENE